MAWRGVALFLSIMWVLLATGPHPVSAITKAEKQLYRDQVLEMFFHAYNSYMDYAYPADELMPLSCKGRVRGIDRSRGSVDEALGRFSLTLIDSLDTLAVLGAIDEFSEAIQLVLRDVRYDSDLVVSVFETNIRVLGGLLGAHFAAVALRDKGYQQLSWYSDQLLEKAEEVGQRLLPAFNTSTGLPYPKVNLQRGMAYGEVDTTTCTACAGTNILEFAALSRVTGNPVYEMRARRAMEAIWQARHHGHDLVGTTIDVNSGQWTRKDSGVGAGIDSYYEYCLKSYILLGDTEYLHRFNKHYAAIKKYISNGPLLVDVNMSSPNKMVRSFMDALLAFWPGLQVLWGDIGAAIHTHDMLYHVTERHNFLPEAFTLDFRVHWGSHPLRPEFIESTYFLYKATCDPYYLDVGKTVIENLNKHARVHCGFAGLKDVKTNSHEDRMDSFVLAETFKYLYLLFAEEEDLVLDMDDFVFNTEAHIFPLSLAKLDPPSSSPRATSSSPRNTDPTDKPADGLPPLPPHTSSPSSVASESVVMTLPLVCHKDSLTVPFIEADRFEKIMLRQCTTSRFGIRPVPVRRKDGVPTSQPRLTLNSLNFNDPEQLSVLKDMGIVVQTMAGGRVQISHAMQKARNQQDAEEGWYLMQEIVKVMDTQKATAADARREAKQVRILSPDVEEDEITVGPALFGPDLGRNEFQVAAELVSVEEGSDGCSPLSEELGLNGKIALIPRGGCLFINKVRHAQRAGAAGAIVADNTDYDEGNSSVVQAFSMSGDGTQDDVEIPSVFMQRHDAQRLRHLLDMEEEVYILLTWLRGEGEEGEEGSGKGVGEKEGEREFQDSCVSGDEDGCHDNQQHSSEGQGSLFDDGYGEWNRDSMESERDNDSGRDSEPSSHHNSSPEKSNH